MKPQEPPRSTSLGDHQLKLPEGLTLTDWTIEKVRWQNPRIRAFLGCMRLLSGVLESNYAILHCSPERLREIWGKVREVGELIRTEIDPLLRVPSRFPDLEQARHRAELFLNVLGNSVLANLEELPAEVPPDQLVDVRKLLCVSIGKLHGFLHDAFGEIMANDPRSLHDADYFLSKRFPQDLEEAEWLHATVSDLHSFLEDLERDRAQRLGPLKAELQGEARLPVGETWEAGIDFLTELAETLTAKLKEVLALRGIRFYEMEILDRYSEAIPARFRALQELYSTGRKAIEEMKKPAPRRGRSMRDLESSLPERERSVRDLETCHAVFGGRIHQLIREIETEVQDLVAFVPIWLDGITRRRALLLKGHLEQGEERP